MKDHNEKDNSITLIVIIISVITVIVMSWIYTYQTLKPLNNEARGTFGDMFGGLNALFSGLAFGGVILTIYLQSRELSLQRDELRETKNEIKIQNDSLSLQRFEHTFFNSIEILHSIIDNIKVRRKDLNLNDGSTFTENGRDILKRCGKRLSIIMALENSDFRRSFYSEYNQLYIDFDQYFRNLFNIIIQIDELELKMTNQFHVQSVKMKYIDILKVQLNQYDFFWIFYFCLLEDRMGIYKPLIEKYSFFSGLDLILVKNINHRMEYLPIAFERA